MLYEQAVRTNPRKPGEGTSVYLVRIAELVAAGKVVPPVLYPRQPGEDDE